MCNFITPDGERTMNTYLGAGAQLSMGDLNEESIKNCNILYMEGYLWDRLPSKEAFMYASSINKQSGGKMLYPCPMFFVLRHIGTVLLI